MPFVSVVFPLPRSPASKTRTGAVSRFANSRPQFAVSSAERVMISSATFNVSHELAARGGEIPGDFLCQHAGYIRGAAGHIRRGTMQIHTQSQDSMPVRRAELRRECGKDAGEYVAGTAFCQSRIAGGVDEELSFWRGNDRVKTLEHYESVPFLRGVAGSTQPV